MTAPTLATPGAMHGVGAVHVRGARDDDGAALVALAARCPMAGDVALCVDRAPDFFALNRLEGARWQVGVAESNAAGEKGASVVGCVAVADREAYVDGGPAPMLYVSDLKVDPAHRGGPAADLLQEHARAVCRAWGGRDALVLVTVLAGNRPMERRTAGPRGLPRLARVGTIRAHAVPLLWRRDATVAGVRVRAADARDLEAMAALWQRVATGRQLAPVLDAARLEAFIAAAPGLAIDDYLLAHDAAGRLLGFVALWDQRVFKQLRVTGYSPRLRVVRAALNAIAPLAGSARLPRAGAPLRQRAALHPCVPADRPDVLRALLLAGYDRLRGGGDVFFTVGLDVRDPLAAALGGLGAQPTDVHAYVTTPDGRPREPAFDARPLHFEIALV